MCFSSCKITKIFRAGKQLLKNFLNFVILSLSGYGKTGKIISVKLFVMGKFIQDLKDFAMKGNVIDMAVGVIVGDAFGLIVKSLVDDVIMPVFGLITGGIDFKDMKYVLQEANPELGKELVTLNYGLFIQTVVNFFIIALSIFFAIRTIQRFKRKQKEEVPAAAPEPSKEEQLLTEIRDLLKEKK